MRPDAIYKVNLRRLALMCLPHIWRRPVLSAILYAGVQPLGAILGKLREFRQTTGYRLRHNGQICKLRGLLNDEFDPVQRRITIEDGQGGGTSATGVIYNREVARCLMVPARTRGAVLLRLRGFSGVGGLDFWIECPAEILTEQNEARMRALVNTYKLASKRYDINTK